jgi:cation-transporting ATPase 13A3/4/5
MEKEESVALLTLREAGFVIIYFWSCCTPVLMIVWCYFNQRISPVPGSSQPLLAQVDGAETYWIQTGYQGFGSSSSTIGFLLYCLTMITLFGYQILLAALTVFYYVQQGAISWFSPVFEDEIQVLKVYEITWGVAFFYTVLLKWPKSIRSIFYRRSTLSNATHVAVMTPVGKERMGEESNYKLQVIKGAITFVKQFVNRIMSVIYCDTRVDNREYDVTFCAVQSDENGIRHFFFRLRRYNFDEESRLFLPGSMKAGETFEDFVQGRSGLDSVEVSKRKSVVGSNVIQMSRPFFILTMINEFSKFFYTYQIFMIWTWFPLWYVDCVCIFL